MIESNKSSNENKLNQGRERKRERVSVLMRTRKQTKVACLAGQVDVRRESVFDLDE